MRPLFKFSSASILAILLAACAVEADLPGPSSAILRIPVEPTAPAASPTPGLECIPAFAHRENARVTYVTDGDSFEVDIGGVAFRVRMIGMNAPEMGGEPFADEAAETAGSLLGGKEIVMIRDLSEADRYGRLLRYVFADGLFINRELVRLGLARARVYPPDTACQDELDSAETEAQSARRGLWEGLPVDTAFLPDVSAGGGCRNGCAVPPAGCLIKGNINFEGEKIYHVPGGEYYEQTVIEPEKGERWFCSEEDAVQAGWRRSKK